MAFVKVLRRELDKGESEAIALALQAQADWTLLDEKEGRRVAKSLGLRVTGVLGILLCARLKRCWRTYAGRQAFIFETIFLRMF